MTAVFAFFVSFLLRLIFVSLQISMFRMDAKQGKKASISLPFRLISLRSKNDSAFSTDVLRNSGTPFAW
jgi:hypothetical protein